MKNFFSLRATKILIVLILTCIVLTGVIVSSIPAAIEKVLVLGGDYLLGSGTTSLRQVKLQNLSRFRFEGLSLKNPSSFTDGNFLELEAAQIYLTDGSLFSAKPKEVVVLLDGVEVTIDAAVGADGLKLNLLDVYRKVQDQVPARGEGATKEEPESGPPVRLTSLKVSESRLTGKIRLPGGRVESISLKIPPIIYAPEPPVKPTEPTGVGEIYREALDLLIGTSLMTLETASEKWKMSKGERDAFLLMLRSWSDEGVSELVKDRLQGQVKKVLEKRLPSGLKGLLGGDESSED